MQVHTKPPRLGTMDVEVNSPALSHEGGRQAGTVLDDTDMHRMGKVQELKVCLVGRSDRQFDSNPHSLEYDSGICAPSPH
jgi:hypothetical protein